MAQPVQCGHCGDPIPANSSKAGHAQYHCATCQQYYEQLRQQILEQDGCDCGQFGCRICD